MRGFVTAWAPWCVGIGASVLWSVAQPGAIPVWGSAIGHALIVVGALAAAASQQQKQATHKAVNVHDSHAQLVSSLQILQRQVQAGIDKSESAVMETVHTLGQIQQISAALHSDASSAIEHSHIVSADLQKLTLESQQALQTMERHQNALAMHQARKDAQVAQAMLDVASLSPLVEVVGAIAKQTHLLSFNAATEAARAGNAGSGFKIVATEVRALAQQTTAAAQQIKEGIAKVQTAVKSNNLLYAADVQDMLASVDAIRALLTRNVEHSAALGPFLLQLSQGMDQGTATLREQVVQALGQMQFQDILRQLLTQVEQGLEALSLHLAVSAQDAQAQLALGALMQQWQDGYVMLEQRIAHTMQAGSAAGVGAKIELF